MKILEKGASHDGWLVWLGQMPVGAVEYLLAGKVGQFLRNASKDAEAASAVTEGPDIVEGSSNPIRPDFGFFPTFRLLSGACRELLWWLGVPGKWLLNLGWLICFVVAMLPAFIPVFLHYLFSPRVVKNIHYGPSIRHQLDVYLPQSEKKDGKKKPVVIFITGGAWTIGYKTWAFMMGKVFQDNDVILVAPDYRNFPQAVVSEMVCDIQAAVQWVFEHIEDIGGDVKRITLIGQSAGAHLSALAVIDFAEQEARGVPTPWRASDLENWVAISGPYDIVQLTPILHRRGLHRGIIKALMGGQDLAQLSPMQRVGQLDPAAAALLPPVSLFHGTADRTIPPEQCTCLADCLRRAGARVRHMRLYEGMSHTDPILENPAAGRDPLTLELLDLLHAGAAEGTAREPVLLPARLPRPLLWAARFSNPF